ncbi:hypothetical protein [Flavobacterium sp.]|uniref:hypothetical protein n=1 Tax=Flavobacterium sp. TaxID=239 RepID=UPI003266A61B
MKILKIAYLIILLYFVSCSSDENQAEESNIKSYHYTYMDYLKVYYVPSGSPQSNGAAGSVKLEYDSQNRIIKRIGGLSPLPASIGFEAYLFSDEVIEDIVYTNNEIKITKNIDLFFQRKMILDNKNRIIKKIIFNKESQLNDSIFYTYNNLNQIEETLKLYARPNNYQYKFYQKAMYYYNQKQNLDSIVTVNFEEGPNVTGTDVYRTVEKFSNYDNATNPLKKLIIFDETYFRALSKNNYAKYEYLKYYNNELIQQNTSNYNYRYDASGNINYDFVTGS